MTPQAMRGRYAPSPTGTLHLGNLRTALLAWLFARHAGGAFALRVEDLDLPRVRPGMARRQLQDLRRLGLNWDDGPDLGGPYGPYVQSQRQALYEAALGKLRERGSLYPCYCSRSELARLASAPHAGDHTAPYDGACRTLTRHERERLEAQGRRPAWRFRAPAGWIHFRDTLAGEVSEDVRSTVGDFVVRRSDGVVAYQLAVVVDDALMGITQVVRGADLLPSTARQLALYDALGYPRPTWYAHVPLALDAGGERMAKRDAASELDALRARRARPQEVLGALAASVGLWPRGMPATLGELLSAFRPEDVRREPSVVLM
jgi:glutamyl-tRNA synthetase